MKAPDVDGIIPMLAEEVNVPALELKARLPLENPADWLPFGADEGCMGLAAFDPEMLLLGVAVNWVPLGIDD